MNAATLDTEGYTTFNGKMTGQTFTAHPKVDPKTGSMIAFGYASSGLCSDDCTFYEVTPEGALLRELWFKAPYYCMMHDFAITEDYALFHIVPSIGSWERLKKGLPHFGFDTTLPVYLGVLPRRADATAKDIRWFKRANCFASHVLNAFQDGTKIHFDIPEAKNNMFPFFPDVHGAPFNGAEALSYLARWTVDMSSDSAALTRVERLSDTAAEFPRIDNRFTRVPYRHGWLLGMDLRRPVELRGAGLGGGGGGEEVGGRGGGAPLAGGGAPPPRRARGMVCSSSPLARSAGATSTATIAGATRLRGGRAAGSPPPLASESMPTT